MKIEIVQFLTDEFIKESTDRAIKMKCSFEIAQYIMILEKRLLSAEEQLEKLWDEHAIRSIKGANNARNQN